MKRIANNTIPFKCRMDYPQLAAWVSNSKPRFTNRKLFMAGTNEQGTTQDISSDVWPRRVNNQQAEQ